MTSRPLPRHWLRSDVALALCLGGLSAFVGWLTHASGLPIFQAQGTIVPVLAGSVALCVPLVWRRRFPVSSGMLVPLVYMVSAITVGIETYVTQVVLFISFYSIGAWTVHRRRALLARLLVCLAMAAWLSIGIVTGSAFGALSSPLVTYRMVLVCLINIAFFAGAWIFGERSWVQAIERAELEQAYSSIQALENELVSHAVKEEKLRIARELHDVVAHHLTAMSVHAAAARRLLRRAPDQAEESLKQVESSARLAVRDLRSLVLTLRENGSESEVIPTLDQLEDLAASMTRAGTQVNIERIGQPPPLSPAQELTLFRVAQESLTNVAKHAGRHASATLRLRASQGVVELEVSDNGLGTTSPTPGTGTGLIGMRERLAAVGGTLEAGVKPRGGFLVRAVIPTGDNP